MDIKLLIIILIINNLYITSCYYSVKLNKIYLPVLPNNNSNIEEVNSTFYEHIQNSYDYNDLPMNYSELDIINDSFIETDNIKLVSYTASLYIGSNNQFFKLVLSTFDYYTTLASINCINCKVLNKYNAFLSNTSLEQITDASLIDENFKSKIIQDQCLIPSYFIQDKKKFNNKLKISKLNFQVIDNDLSGFLNSNLTDGILALNYINNTEIPNNNFIMELYKEGYISSPAFSIIITSSNINRLYFGDIMKNEYVKNYLINNYDMNKGECPIIENENNWVCKLHYIEYNALRYENWEKHSELSRSLVKFDIKENKLVIPDKYYLLIVIGYKTEKKKIGKRYYTKTIYNKQCMINTEGYIVCNCKDLDDFGIVSFYFKDGYKLDIDLRDYAHYDENAMYKCRIDISLSFNNEFIVGLKGLNNTILSFDMKEKKINFFHKKKENGFTDYSVIFYIIIIIMIVLSSMIKINI